MAKTTNPLWTGYKGFRGAVLKQIVFRTYGESTYVSKYPDMTNIIPSESQLKEKRKFAEAVKFAREIVNDPVKKAAYKAAEGKSVYHTAIKDYMEQG
ncbi:hypothetical protein GO495_29220 [Chitinophaga oryziterrae]|uniref:Uncharacterized protein n=1 Tax=Chitinophaga oryziterrae TaxID=1031224 RepID=A0A6N8JHM2_9BACT|nr:hypothetical protein [Chitinophaga oryziterrae]MVT44710.1 hypothetical protein [Chitinophaga oryziterrae]